LLLSRLHRDIQLHKSSLCASLTLIVAENRGKPPNFQRSTRRQECASTRRSSSASRQRPLRSPARTRRPRRTSRAPYTVMRWKRRAETVHPCPSCARGRSLRHLRTAASARLSHRSPSTRPADGAPSRGRRVFSCIRRDGLGIARLFMERHSPSRRRAHPRRKSRSRPSTTRVHFC
jgi:hypothetical protein